MTLFQFQIGGVEEIAVRLTGTSATTIVDGTDNAWYVPWVQANENNGDTPSLTMDLYNGTTAYYLGSGGSVWRVKAMTAGQSLTFSEGIFVPKGWKLRATSNHASGRVDLVGVATKRQTT